MKKLFTLLVLAMFAFGLSAQRKSAKLPMHRPSAAAKTKVSHRLSLNIPSPGIRHIAKPSRTASKAPELVTVPDDANILPYTPSGSLYTYNGTDWEAASFPVTMNVAFCGNDVYIQGLAHYFPEAWVKGTLADDKVTFATGQYVGEDDYGTEYLIGSDAEDESGESIIDYFFNYDAESGILTLDPSVEILESESADDATAFSFIETLTLTPGGVELVTPPADLEASDWIMEARALGSDEEGGEVYEDITKPLMIGIDGDDFYVQGLCEYLPEAWIKGTRQGSSVVFPAGQYMGTYETIDWSSFSSVSYNMYFAGILSSGTDDDLTITTTDAVFSIDAEGKKLTTANVIGFVDSPEGGNCYVWIEDAEIIKVNATPAVPASPVINEVKIATTYPYVAFNVPLSDVDGNAIAPSKLEYQLFYDIEEDVNPYVFQTEDYQAIDNEMETVPYLYTDNYDIITGNGHIVYLYGDQLNKWNRIGIMSIYSVGGEVNESEIAWYEIKPYGSSAAENETTFDFNALTEAEQPVSTSSSHSGDITEDKVIKSGNVSLTVSPSGANTPNRYWKHNNTGLIQLRVYGGTLTFQSDEQNPITGITFYNGKWNEYNEADSGTLYGSSPATWTGNAQEVVISIGGNTQLDKIVVTTTSTTTGITTTKEYNEKASATFDLQGRRVSQPRTNGIYITGGKKIIL